MENSSRSTVGIFELSIWGLFISLFNFKLWGGDISWWIVVSPFGAYLVILIILVAVLGIVAGITRNE